MNLDRSARQSAVSFVVTVAVVLALVISVPVHAVTLNLSAPEEAAAGTSVQFALELDLEDGERIPIRDATIVIHRPGGSTETCVFDERGLPLSGCEDFVIGLAEDDATFAESERHGSGWNGTAEENTSFGFGYGHGSVAADTNEFAWDVVWNTAGEAPGDYTVEYFVTAEGGDVTRDYRMVTLEETTLTAPPPDEPSVEIAVKEWYPQGNDYVFECNADGFTPSSYSWYFGDGHQLEGTTHQDIYHTYANNGSYIVRCVASNGVVTEEDTLGITVGAVEQPEEPPEEEPGVCHSTVYDIPATCDGGSITQDSTASGCRIITCSGDGGSLEVLACNKPGDHDAQFFEMYKRSQTDAPPEICLGETCIQDNGFARSGDYPVCTGTPPEDPEPPVGDEPEATLSISPWYPQGRDYVFHCEDNFGASSFDWTFGDGQKLVDVANDNVYHHYMAEGTYEVSCTAKSTTESATSGISVTVS